MVLCRAKLTSRVVYPHSLQSSQFNGPGPTHSTTAPSRNVMHHQDYTIGWICALPTERVAAVGMLDSHHDPLPQPSHDTNIYTLGGIGSHNVVIACLPAGVTGTNSAAIVATRMLSTFTSIRFGLMVGIGGGVPGEGKDIRLGDVVVSEPGGTSGGVIQYDFGKTVQAGRFVRTGSLNRPPDVLLTAVASLQAKHMIEDPGFSKHLLEIISKYPKLRDTVRYQGLEHDILFAADYDHREGDVACTHCDMNRLEPRDPRKGTDPEIHYGLIASGNQVMRDGSCRDKLRKELNVLCFEMEAAGLMDNFPCLVIRGICDYADSHKNNRWQAYAAATAAAYAKELLHVTPQSRVIATPFLVEEIKQTALVPESARRESFALHEACSRGDLGGVQSLVSSGADINAVDPKEFTPLMIAVEKDNFKIVDFLLGLKARTETVSRSEKSALGLAIDNGNIQIARLLLDNDADPNANSNDGMMLRTHPLGHAVMNGDEAMVRLLLEKKANPNGIPRNGRFRWTPMHLAIKSLSRQDGIIKSLLEHGAKIDKADSHGSTPINYFLRDSTLGTVLVGWLSENRFSDVAHVLGSKFDRSKSKKDPKANIMHLVLSHPRDGFYGLKIPITLDTSVSGPNLGPLGEFEIPWHEQEQKQRQQPPMTSNLPMRGYTRPQAVEMPGTIPRGPPTSTQPKRNTERPTANIPRGGSQHGPQPGMNPSGTDVLGRKKGKEGGLLGFMRGLR